MYSCSLVCSCLCYYVVEYVFFSSKATKEIVDGKLMEEWVDETYEHNLPE